MQEEGPTTLMDVARQAKVSVATVSRVINGLPTRETTRLKVERAAKELNYRPNRVAQSLRAGTSKFVGIIIPDLGHVSYATMVRAAQEVLEPHGYQVLIMSTHRSTAEDQKAIVAMQQNRVDGLLIASYGGLDHAPTVPTVFLDHLVRDGAAASVLPANREGVQLLVDHLVQVHGYSEIGYLGPTTQLTAGTERREGFADAMRRNNLPSDPSWIFAGDRDWSPASAAAAVSDAFATLPRRPRALVAASDTLAVGAIHAAHELGLRVPDDLAVVSFDDPEFGGYMTPTLTALRPVETRIGAAAARMLLQAFDDPDAGPTYELRIPTDLVIRRSCGCP